MSKEKFYMHYNFLSTIEPNKNLITNHDPVGYNNPNLITIPNSDYTLPSVYGHKVIEKKDFIKIINNYNKKDFKKFNKKFNYKNLNSTAVNLYNDICWNKGWVNYKLLFSKNIYFLPDIKEFPQIYKICFKTILDFITKLKEFHLGKHKIDDIFISNDKKTIKFVTVIALTKNINSSYFVIKLNTYYNKEDNTIGLGKALFLGLGSTGDIILPTGNDKLINENMGKSLNELHDYDLINYRKATDMYWRHIYYYK